MEAVVFSLNLIVLFLLAAGAFLIFFYLLRKYIFFWFDPLLIYIIFNACSIAFVIYLFFFANQIKEAFYVITFISSTIGFLAGSIICSRAALKKIKRIGAFNTQVAGKYDQVFDIFLAICLFIVIGSNLAMLFSVGTLPILSADPSSAKVELYVGGWGLVRRIDLASVNFIFSISLLKLFHPSQKISIKKKIFCTISILIGIVVLLTMGSKGSLINIFNSLFGVAMINLYYKGVQVDKGDTSKINLKTLKSFGKYVFIIAVAYMFLVIVKTGVETSATNSFLTRMVGTGDTYYYFYVYDLYHSFNLSPVDYLLHIINPILGFLRLAPYEFPIGAYMLTYAFNVPLSSFGPNAQHPIEGLLYFGKYGTFFYSFGVGYLISFLRLSLLHKVLKNPNFLQLGLYITLASIAVSAATEINFFLLLFYDVLIFGAPLFLLSLAIKNYLILRKTGSLKDLQSSFVY